MMKELLKEVFEASEREYARASKKYGPTNTSDHESYAIMLEEFEEAEDEFEELSEYLNKFWENTKKDESDSVKKESLLMIQRKAIYAACELIQVAATARKADITLQERNKSVRW